jgi:outer membrane receptor protein involved in Fe transport
VFYIKNYQAFAPSFATIFGTVFSSYAIVVTKGYSAYGEAYFKPIPALTLIGGLRYSYEKKEFTGGRAPHGPFIGSADFSAWTPRLAAIALSNSRAACARCRHRRLSPRYRSARPSGVDRPVHPGAYGRPGADGPEDQ